jgi:hypothetical protein
VQDLPTHAELVEAVREFLETDVFPVVAGRTRFHTRVAMNGLGIVQRELEQSGRGDGEYLARLRHPRAAERISRILSRSSSASG